MVALGGMLGASARFGLERTWATDASALPWATLVTNVSGCALIGVLMVFVTEVGGAHPLLRPFLGIGLLGGYTTFSTYAVQAHALLLGGHPGTAVAYVFGTALGAMAAVGLGVHAARAGVRAHRSRSDLGARQR